MAIISIINRTSIRNFGNTFFLIFFFSSIASFSQFEKEIISVQPQNLQEYYPIVRVLETKEGGNLKTTSSCWSNLDASYVNVINDLYGASGYASNNPKDDGSYGPIALGWNYNFYGQNYDAIYINVNGNITFGNLYDAYSASGFPSSSVPAMIAPFWGDVDLRGVGSGANQIYVKVESNKVTVQWIEVGYYNSNSDKSNTFQVILTDGTDSEIGIGYNTRFGYKEMDWCVGDASGGTDGFGSNVYGTVGAQSEGGANFYQIGLFGQDNYAYDGAGGSLDGIHYLDGRCFTMDLTSANVPPIATDFPNSKEIGLCPGMTYSLSSSFSAPEISQNVTTEVMNTTLSNFSVTSSIGNLSGQNISILVEASDIGQHFIYYHSYDNGTPIAHTYDTLVINVYDCSAEGAGTSLAFDGVDDYVQVAHHNSLYSGGSGTYSMWVYPVQSNPSKDVFFISKGDQYELGLKASSNFFFFKGKIGTQWYELTSNAAANLNDWSHVSGVVTESKMYLYVNQIKQDSVEIQGVINSTGKPFLIGTNDTKESFFRGRIDELAIISTLTNDEGMKALPWELGNVDNKYIRAYFKCSNGVDLKNEQSLYNGALINFDTENCWEPNYAAVWTGAVNSNWTTPGNWENGLPPLAQSNGSLEPSKHVIFPAVNVGTNALSLQETVDVNTIVFLKNSNVQIESTGKLKVNKDVFSIESPLYFGEVLMNGLGSQSLFGSNHFHNLTIDSDVLMHNDQDVKGVLTLNSKTFTTNGFELKVLSDSISTGEVFHNSGSVSGQVTMERFLPYDKDAIGWRYLSSPFQNMSFSEIDKNVKLTGLGNGPNDNPWPNVYTYNETFANKDYQVGWWSPSSVSTTIEDMEGFILYHSIVGGTKINIEGVLNSGSLSRNLTYTPSGKSESDGWHLIGNPYPSMIDWDLVEKPVGMDNAFYVYDYDKDQYASYVNGVSINGGIDKIATMQSFFVHVNQSTNFQLTNDCRTTGNNSLHFRTKTEQIWDVIKVQVSNGNDVDETAVVINPISNKIFDEDYDAYKLIGTSSKVSIYTLIENNKISINSIPSIEGSVIDLVVEGKRGAEYILNLPQSKNTNTISVFLEDKLTDSIHDLSDEKSYRFVLDSSSSGERFNLVFSKKGNVTSIDKNSNTLYSVISSGKEIIVNGIKTECDISVIDVNGRVCNQFHLKEGEKVIDLSYFAEGIYFVDVISKSSRKTFKVWLTQ